MVQGILILLAFQLAGEALRPVLGMPGPVIGMGLLLGAVLMVPALMDLIRPVATALLAHLSLLFVPASVGIIAHLGQLGGDLVALSLAITVSTLLSLAAGAWAFAVVARRTGLEADDE